MKSPSKRIFFISIPTYSEFLGYSGEPTSLLYAIAPTVDQIEKGNIQNLSSQDIMLLAFRYASELVFNDIKEKIRSHTPALVCLSSTTPALPIALMVARFVKEHHPHTVTVIGGAHENHISVPSALTSADIDFSVCGDGEFALEYLVRTIFSFPGKSPVFYKNAVGKDADAVRKLPGNSRIVFRCSEENKSINLSMVPLDLDSLPLIPRHLLHDDITRNFEVFKRYGKNAKTAQIITRLGVILSGW